MIDLITHSYMLENIYLLLFIMLTKSCMTIFQISSKLFVMTD